MQVLNQLCDVIFESLRDRVVTGLLQASLVGTHSSISFDILAFIDYFTYLSISVIQDGLLRVLLDGGPSQLFLPSDAKLMEEDLEVLKVLHLFIFTCFSLNFIFTKCICFYGE
jgi:hypothetical protein